MNYRTAIKNRRQKQGAINSQVKDAMRGLTPRTAKLTYDLSHDLKNVFDNDRNAYVKAIQAVSNLVDSFALPSRPKYSLCGMVKSATAKDGTVTDGIIRINAILSTLMGHKASIDIPVIIREKMLVEPAVFFYDGAPYVMCKAAFDQLVKRGTLQKDLAPRSMYSAPFDGEVAEAEPPRQPIINRNHMFSPGSMNPWKFRRYSQNGGVVDEVNEAVSPMTPKKTLDVGSDGKWEPMSEDKSADPGQADHMGKIWQLVKGLSTTFEEMQKIVKNYNEISTTHRALEDDLGQLGEVLGGYGEYDQKTIVMRIQSAIAYTDDLLALVGGNQQATSILTNLKQYLGTMLQSPPAPAPNRFKAAQKEKVQRERTNIDTPTEMPELWGNYTEDQMLDPAERCRHDMVQVGSEVSLNEDFEVRERGGSQIVIPSGEEGKVIKDVKGDGMCMVVHFPVMHLDAIVPVKFLKGGSRTIAATVDQVKHEIREMLREGYQDIDIQAAITQKYPDVAEEALSGLK